MNPQESRPRAGPHRQMGLTCRCTLFCMTEVVQTTYGALTVPAPEQTLVCSISLNPHHDPKGAPWVPTGGWVLCSRPPSHKCRIGKGPQLVGLQTHRWPSWGHSGRAGRAGVSPAHTTPAPGESRGRGGHRACPRAGQPELGCSPRDPQAGYTGCRPGAQRSGIFTL